jgi:RNA polymerase sigma factor (TIGR02999 family)
MFVKMNQPENKQNITGMLRQWSDGQSEALDKLMPLVYDELRRQAARFLRRERAGHTLQTTALIHEAYLKLIDQRAVNWESRTQFFGLAATAMRRILVDYARRRQREKRGGAGDDLPLDEALQIAAKQEKSLDLIALDEALTKLAEIDAQQARVVELRYFADLSLEQTAETLGISRATAARNWNMAKAWLLRELSR